MNYSYVNENGKLISGPPALVHYIYTVMGGVKNYNDSVGETYIKKFVQSISDEANSEIERKAKKTNLKAIYFEN